MRFALVIPALNEEEAIAGTLRRALAARAKVLAQTPVTEMTIVFVNDGCTDRTQEIVDQDEFHDVVKVNYGRNRGYGAAIKAGWQAVDADLLGFVDADGTCDPDFCVPLINRMFEANADVVLAGRLNPNSEMPLIRQIGNKIFATLLGVVSGHTEITDTASGFRVVRRANLKLMSPLPDGLHFTPAMSCICLLDPRLRIEEVPMPYKERIGRSKLSVIKDGFRFLFTILFSAACYSPIKTTLAASGLVLLGALLAVGALALAWAPRVASGATGLAGDRKSVV
jgi:glycosyltransferase involved in cell wall biosynthesis